MLVDSVQVDGKDLGSPPMTWTFTMDHAPEGLPQSVRDALNGTRQRDTVTVQVPVLAAPRISHPYPVEELDQEVDAAEIGMPADAKVGSRFMYRTAELEVRALRQDPADPTLTLVTIRPIHATYAPMAENIRFVVNGTQFTEVHDPVIGNFTSATRSLPPGAHRILGANETTIFYSTMDPADSDKQATLVIKVLRVEAPPRSVASPGPYGIAPRGSPSNTMHAGPAAPSTAAHLDDGHGH